MNHYDTIREFISSCNISIHSVASLEKNNEADHVRHRKRNNGDVSWGGGPIDE